MTRKYLKAEVNKKPRKLYLIDFKNIFKCRTKKLPMIPLYV
jgi:hypothetical protein